MIYMLGLPSQFHPAVAIVGTHTSLHVPYVEDVLVGVSAPISSFSGASVAVVGGLNYFSLFGVGDFPCPSLDDFLFGNHFMVPLLPVPDSGYCLAGILVIAPLIPFSLADNAFTGASIPLCNMAILTRFAGEISGRVHWVHASR
jgi:hypothetical protein